MSATWDIFLSSKMEVRRALATQAVQQALADGEVFDDDLARPTGSSVPWTRIGEIDELLVPPIPSPAMAPTAPQPFEPPTPDAPLQNASTVPSATAMYLESVSEPPAASFKPIYPPGELPPTPSFDRPTPTPSSTPIIPDPDPALFETAALIPPNSLRLPAASTDLGGSRDFAAAVWGTDESRETPINATRVGDGAWPSPPSADFEEVADDNDDHYFAPAPAQLADDDLFAEIDDEEINEDELASSGSPLGISRQDTKEEDEAEAAVLLAGGPTGGVEDLDLTAMADIAMQMIMFLLVAATVVYFKTLEIPTPNPDDSQAVAQEMKTLEDLMKDFILVEIAADGSIQIDREPVPSAQLVERLRTARTDTLRTSMLLSAEFSTPHSNAVAALDAANEIGLAIAIAKPTNTGQP
jgi:biopolymer transport protein ExbD